MLKALENKENNTLNEQIIPISLSFLLPLIGLYSNTEVLKALGIPFFYYYVLTTFGLYVIWHTVSLSWNINFKASASLTFLGRALFIAAVSYLFYRLRYKLNIPPENHYMLRGFLAVPLFLLVQYSIRSQKKLHQLQLSTKQALSEKYLFELQTIRAKIDPHFLFNTLNVLRSMVRQQHPNSEQFVLNLSHFYRKILYFNERASLSLKEELEVLSLYLYLMENRSAEAFQLDIKINTRHYDYCFPTLVLQNVLENCFKHNRMSSQEPLSIKIFSSGLDTISIENNIQPKWKPVEGIGFGLQSIKKRYEILGVHDGLSILQDEETYTIKLKLIPNERPNN